MRLQNRGNLWKSVSLTDMALVVSIDILAVGVLFAVALTKGFERTLPLAACLMLLFPNESQIKLPGLFDITTQRLVVIALFGLYMVLGKTSDESGRKREVPLKYLMAIQIIWMSISTANSVVVTVSLKTVISQILDYFLVFYIFTRTVSRLETIHKILYSLVIAMVICSVLGAIEAYSGWSVVSLFPPAPGRFSGGIFGAVADSGIRARSTFGHAILFGGALAMAIPLTLYLITVARTWDHRLFLWAGLMLMFLNIYKTGSRGPWLALVLSLGLLLVFGQGRARKYMMTMALLTVIVLVARPGVWESLGNIYHATEDPYSPKGSSYQWRYALYREAVKQLDKDLGRALWGYGPESFAYLNIEDEFQGRVWVYDSCDSSIAALLIETGYAGLLITALLLLKPALVAYRSFRKLPRPANSLCMVLLANMLAFYFLMTNVAIYGWGQQSYMLWILIALAMVQPRLQGLESAPKAPAAVDATESAPQLVEPAVS